MKKLFLGIFSYIKAHAEIITISALSLISVAAITTTVWAVWLREAPMLDPDYAAKETDKGAEKIEGSEGTGESGTMAGGKVNLIYSDEITVYLSNGTAELLVGNSAKSKHNIVAELVIRDKVILQTGAVKPGYRIVDAELEQGAAEILQSGIYNGTLKLYMYDIGTNEREMLSADIAVKVSVKE